MTLIAELKQCVQDEIAPAINRLRVKQDTSGRIVQDNEQAVALLDSMRKPVQKVFLALGMRDMAAAFEADVAEWILRGLDQPPRFDRSLAVYAPPADHELTFFAGPFVCTNGPTPTGYFMECFLAERAEPGELLKLAAQMPNPLYMGSACRLLAASTGLMKGNCIVFFPENVATATKVESQTFALFFFNKSHHIFFKETLPLVRDLLGPMALATEKMGQAAAYDALGIWSYLHEYYHHRGPRPLHKNLRTKMNFFAGLLEEIKVDCQSVILCKQSGLPYAREVMEFVLLERLFRYPHQPNPANNFDAGTGYYMFEWLRQNGYGLAAINGKLSIDMEKCIEGMVVLVRQIEALEAIPDDQAYKAAAKQMVQQILLAGQNGERFIIPPAYVAALGETHALPELDFAEMDG